MIFSTQFVNFLVAIGLASLCLYLGSLLAQGENNKQKPKSLNAKESFLRLKAPVLTVIKTVERHQEKESE